jgi:hypothetical protein
MRTIGFKLDEYEFCICYKRKEDLESSLSFELRGDFPPEISNQQHKTFRIRSGYTPKQTVITTVKELLGMAGYDVNNIVKCEYMMEVVKENYE